MGVVQPAHNNVRTLAHIGRNSRLGANVFPSLVVCAYLDTRKVTEFLGIGQAFGDSCADELLRTRCFL